MINIYDTANQLEREIRQTEQFKALEQAVKALKENKASYDLFKEFQAFQQANATENDGWRRIIRCRCTQS